MKPLKTLHEMQCQRISVCYSDLERSVEEMRAGAGLNHHLVTEQEIEQKTLELRRLGETVTELKSEWRKRDLCRRGNLARI